METRTQTAATLRDPVCGMAADRATAERTAAHDGERFHFRSPPRALAPSGS